MEAAFLYLEYLNPLLDKKLMVCATVNIFAYGENKEKMAEEERFELSEDVNPRQFSRLLP